MNVLVTGANGFIGKNVCIKLQEIGANVIKFCRDTSLSEIREQLASVDAVLHFAGVNRPQNPTEFYADNAGLTESLCSLLKEAGSGAKILFASSSQAENDSDYGKSKAQAERAVLEYGKSFPGKAAIYRFPNVFGKWARPYYNSAVATFCHNVARGLPIEVSDPNKILQLVYIDDVISACVEFLNSSESADVYKSVKQVHLKSLQDIVDAVYSVRDSRTSGVIPDLSDPFLKAIYATYISYLPSDSHSYPLKRNVDHRGEFVEFLKSGSAGQVSYFTAHPGVVRGGHYHHTKTERFLVVQGTAKFSSRNIVTDERVDVTISAEDASVIETIPGWTHDVTNVGFDKLVVLVWANEVFEPNRPDTHMSKV